LIANARDLARLVGEARWLYAVAAALAMAQSLVLLPIAVLVREMVDQAIPDGRSSRIVLIACALVALYALGSAVAYLARRVATRQANGQVARLRGELFEKVYALPRAWHDRHDPGEVLAVVVNDCDRVQSYLVQLTTSAIPAVAMSVVLCGAAVVLEPSLALVLVVVAILPLVAGLWLGKRSRLRAFAWNTEFRRFLSDSRIAVRTTELAQAYGATDAELVRRRKAANEIARAGISLADAGAAHLVGLQGLSGILGVAVISVGALLISAGNATFGGLAAVGAIVLMLVRQLGGASGSMASAPVAAASIARINDLLEASWPLAYEPGGEKHLPDGRIEVREVTFGYGERPVLSGVDVEITPGEHVALLGPNGSGKSTLLALLLGMHRPDTGEIAYDGVPLDELDVADLRTQLGVALQEPVMLPGTIHENIAYGRPDATRAQVRAAAQWATAAAFIEEFDDGYETQVGEEGQRLSGGQRQRVAIARALLGEPPIILLDEPTAYLDPEGTEELLANLRGLSGTPTVVIVTHDDRAAAHADRIIRLRGGRLETEPVPAA
jgi:ATP-binding cassette subfamily B protein